MLKFLHIQNFRSLRDVTLENLARINVIVGANECGKTSVLEAAYIHLCWGRPEPPTQVISCREAWHGQRVAVERGESLWDWLFLNKDLLSVVRIESDAGSSELRLTPSGREVWLLGENAVGERKGRPIEPRSDPRVLDVQHVEAQKKFECAFRSVLVTENGQQQVSFTQLKGSASFERRAVFVPCGIPPTGATTSARVSGHIAQRRERDLVEPLKMLDASIRGVVVLDHAGSPTVYLDTGLARLVPCSVCGSGVSRLLDVISAFDSCRSGGLLVDEVESNVYLRSMPDVWRALGRLSREHDCQVFAATHSYEAVQALAEAFDEEEEGAYAVYRLDKDAKGDARVRFLDQEALSAAMAFHHEVR
ncbi:MAG: AAA family ATPase [Planctomycetes bacterium]|nr:AAA family ATPase [Planctomycetota bacterium]